jgi:phage shock protein E
MSEVVFVDVREPIEFSQGHVDGAINIPPSELMAGSPKLANIPKEAELVLYCLSGSRSRASSMFLKEQGFTNVVNGINQDHVRAKYM